MIGTDDKDQRRAAAERDRAEAMRLLAVDHLTWKRYLQRGLDRHGLSLKQYHLLRRLARRPFLYPSVIAEMLFCDRPTASVVIANMERKGWLVREKEDANQKRTRVRLTPAGAAKLAAVESDPRHLRRGEFDPLGCFDDDEVRQLQGLLRRLGEMLAQVSEV